MRIILDCKSNHLDQALKFAKDFWENWDIKKEIGEKVIYSNNHGVYIATKTKTGISVKHQEKE